MSKIRLTRAEINVKSIRYNGLHNYTVDRDCREINLLENGWVEVVLHDGSVPIFPPSVIERVWGAVRSE